MLAVAAIAATAAPTARELDALRGRIAALSRDLEQKESARREARDALRDSERGISEANRALAALAAEDRGLRAESARLAERREALERTLAERRAAVERVLVARQALGAPDVLRAALSGDDPQGLTRRLYYIGYVSRAAAALIAGYRADLEALAGLAAEAQAKRERLRAVAQASRADRERLVRERAARSRVLQRVALELKRNRREIGVLRADEARLARLVEGIGRVLAIPEEALQTEAFSRLRGKLRLPVRGELTGRFGAPRGASGIEAKGVFIRAPQGEPVRAIAGGRVVYADWMRGFGNLIIVDHGEHYFSIYANAESLLKQVGDAVAIGEPLATTGASGGNEETGLYFELRHLGRAFDPLAWVKLK